MYATNRHRLIGRHILDPKAAAQVELRDIHPQLALCPGHQAEDFFRRQEERLHLKNLGTDMAVQFFQAQVRGVLHCPDCCKRLSIFQSKAKLGIVLPRSGCTRA